MINVQPSNFIEELVLNDIETKGLKEIITRFPPEPNGYLHIGHSKAITVDFNVAKKFNGRCNLRFDDTNPVKEDVEYVESIKEDIRWLGFQWDELRYASDYFDRLFEIAVDFIKKDLAYVCDLSAEEIKEYRGTLNKPGKNSPYRDRTIEENLDLFYKMKEGAFPDGSKVLRAKIDMASPNINMRDPIMYRILRATHHRTGDKWCVYPMYDYAHPMSDAIEGITHSICTLEFEDHRPLYEWFVNHTDFEIKPRQIEFARLQLTRTIMSKRYLKKLVDNKSVSGWDDPRMPTLSGLRRRGVTKEAIADFCERIGVAKSNSTVDAGLLEYCIREDLNKRATRAMVVLDPVKVVLTNFDAEEYLELENNPQDASAGTHKIPFCNEIYIEREDFKIDADKKFFRLKPEGYVRLKGAYIIKCETYEIDEQGNVQVIYCSVVKNSKSGHDVSGIKTKAVIHWVPVKYAVDVQVRNYDYLLIDGDEDKDFSERMNPNSLKIIDNAKAEPFILQSKPQDKYQFLRLGYFNTDYLSSRDKLIFNSIVSLKDSKGK